MPPSGLGVGAKLPEGVELNRRHLSRASQTIGPTAAWTSLTARSSQEEKSNRARTLDLAPDCDHAQVLAGKRPGRPWPMFA
jgi:hypothetical protein